MAQLAWTSPVTNRLLLEAQFGLGPDAWFGDKQRAEGYNAGTDSRFRRTPAAFPASNTGGRMRSGTTGTCDTYSGSLSYVTGAHRFKVGARQQRTEASFISYYNNYRLRYVFNNGVPVSLTMYGNHAVDNPFEMYTTALYAQDQWTMSRLTLQGGLRFEHISSWYPEAQFPVDLYITTALSVPGAGCRREPEGHQPAVRCGVRRIRQRQDVAQGQPRTISDRRQFLRELRLLAAAGVPRRHQYDPRLE